MKVFVNRESSVPIRDQLIEQIALQIASGSLKGEEKLPSVRALAQRLGIHYNTVSSAYNHLADVGLLEIRQGSGVRVATKMKRRELDLKSSDLDSLLREFLALAAENGFSRAALRERIERFLQVSPIRQILVIDRNPDFHRLQIAELQPHFDLPVRAVTVEELDKDLSAINGSLIVTSLYHVFALKDRPIDPTRMVVCNVEPGRAEQQAVAELPAGSLLLLVSVSPTLLKMATNVMAAMRGEAVAIRTVLLEDEGEIAYTLQYADLAICDLPSKGKLSRLVGKVPLKVFRLYSQTTVDLIKERIGKWG